MCDTGTLRPLHNTRNTECSRRTGTPFSTRAKFLASLSARRRAGHPIWSPPHVSGRRTQLTPGAVLVAVASYHRLHGSWPLTAELYALLRVDSHTLSVHLRPLRVGGMVERVREGVHFRLRVTDAGWRELET